MMIVKAFFTGGIASGRAPEVSLDISKDALERRTLSKTSGCGCSIIRSVQASADSDSSNPVLWLAFSAFQCLYPADPGLFQWCIRFVAG